MVLGYVYVECTPATPYTALLNRILLWEGRQQRLAQDSRHILAFEAAPDTQEPLPSFLPDMCQAICRAVPLTPSLSEAQAPKCTWAPQTPQANGT